MSAKSFVIKTLPIALIVFTIFSITLTDNLQFADAAEPEFNLFVADDPDDLDTILSNGDILTITFSEATNATNNGAMTRAEAIANFTDTDIGADAAVSWGDAYTGLWNADSTILTITITDVTNAVLTIGSSSIEGRTTTNISSAAEGTNTELLDATIVDRTLTGDFGLFVAATPVKKGGGGCSGDCESPTMGVLSNGHRLVDNGFSYNNNPIDVELFFTPYPLVTVDVGKKNVAEFKIYENNGPDKVAHFELAFGLGKGESIDKNQASIIWDKTFDGIETTEIHDPDNTLENVFVTTSEVYCQEDAKQKCLLIKFHHTFRAPLEFNVIGSNVWDIKRNAFQNYYNHGIEVEGDSVNAVKTKTIPGPDRYEGLITVYQTELYSDIYASEDGRLFEFFGPNDSFKVIRVHTVINQDSGDPDYRYHSDFNEWQEFQAELAASIFDSSTIQSYVPEHFAYDYPELDSRTQFLMENNLLESIRN